MANLKPVQQIIQAKALMMGHTAVKQPLPTNGLDIISPFLLLHHFGPTKVLPGQDPLDVAPHPHRGFEPITFLYQGGITHKDSRGNIGDLVGGDVQWMTSGMGIVHSERASRTFLEEGGVMEGIQLWVNLPSEKKMMQPRYQDIKSADIPSISEGEGKVQIRVVAGEYKGQRGPADTQTPIIALQIEMKAGGQTNIQLPKHFNAFAYLLSGEVIANQTETARSEQMIQFDPLGTAIHLSAQSDSRILLMAGQAIDEPLAQYGPFVMNTQTEILEAMRDYQMGKMGML
ncbi:MAG: pirin family protein [Bacteroidota bacterium]